MEEIKDIEVVSRDLSSDAVIAQDNKLTNGRWRMNLNQSRLFLSAVSLITPYDDDIEAYKISALQLKDMLELKGNSVHEQLAKDMPKLMQQYIVVDNPNGKEWISLVSSARYHDGDLYFKFSHEVKPFLVGLKNNFTQFRLLDAMKLKSMYALRFYMLFKQYDKTGWRYMTVEEIRSTLDLDKTKDNDLKKDLYPATASLKLRVINPAIIELNRKGFHVSYTEHKKKRKIVGFNFKWKTGAELIGHNEIIKAETDQGQRLIARLTKYGLSAKQVNAIAELVKGGHLSFKEMAATLYGVDMRIKERNIPKENISGYVYVTLKKKFNLSSF